MARRLGVKGLWRPHSEGADVLWPAIYAWRVTYIHRPYGGALKPDLETILAASQVRTLTYAGAGWLAGQTGGSYAPWADKLKVHRVRLRRSSWRSDAKVPLVGMVYEEGKPIDFELVHDVCHRPAAYGDARGVRIIDIRDNPHESVFQRFARMWPHVEVVAPREPDEMIEALGRCMVYVEIQPTFEPTLWALIAQAHRTLVCAPPRLGWQEWFRTDKNFVALGERPEEPIAALAWQARRRTR